MSAFEFGVDEAGKGPVLGPMVAACVVGPTDELPDGIDDSKALTAQTRTELATRIRSDSAFDVGVARISTDTIDDPDTDMNTLTVVAHANAIDGALDGGSKTAGVLDGADTDADRFARRVGDRVDAQLTVHAEHGGDERYPIVGAASVIAKVERDRAVATIAEEYGDVGSGYPGDPTTRSFLETYVETHGELPDCARSSWKTATDIVASVEQTTLDSL
ncbi:ribonuclease HII [Halocatena halophila]|uniref:ribonuclease HII n=1 Tax=Halocatena halophila TaxID=2814576 RepID=UPI002ED66D7E